MRRFILPILVIAPLMSAGLGANAQPAPEAGAAPAMPAQAARKAVRRKVAARTVRQSAAGQPFIEFRSRYALSYGHTFLVYGRLNSKGQVGPLSAANVAGFHPAGAGPELWTAGHLVPVPSETGPSDGDLEEKYVSARYRVLLTEEQFASVSAYIRAKQSVQVPWHAALYNCNAWVGEVARHLGLQAPANHMLYPANYINTMRRLNTGEVSS